jgi:hypothetical protein
MCFVVIPRKHYHHWQNKKDFPVSCEVANYVTKQFHRGASSAYSQMETLVSLFAVIALEMILEPRRGNQQDTRCEYVFEGIDLLILLLHSVRLTSRHCKFGLQRRWLDKHAP